MNKDALFSIMKDDIDELLDERMRQERLEADARLQQERQESDARLQQERREADARLQQADARLQQADARWQQELRNANELRNEERQQYIKNIMDAFGVTIDKAMDILRIPQAERGLYTSLLQNT